MVNLVPKKTNLKIPEEWYRAMIQTATEGIWLIDAEARTLYANDRMAALLGTTSEELIGRTVYEFVFPEERAEHLERIHHNLYGISEAFDARFRRKDGSEVLVLGSASPLRDDQGNVVGALGMFTDVTQRRRTEQALHRSEALYRTLMETLPQLVWSITADGVMIYANQHCQDYTGLTLAQLNAKGWRPVIHSDDLPQLEQSWKHGMANGETFEQELRLCRADGSAHWFLGRFTPAKDAEGQVVSWLFTATDIHDLKQEELRLDEALGLVDTILDTAPIGFCLLDRSLHYLRVNQHLAEINGLPAEEHIGKTVREVIPSVEPIVARTFQAIEKNGQPVLNVEITGTSLHEPHVPKHWLSSFYPVYARQGSLLGFGTLVVDITERKRHEEALRQSDLRFRRLVESNIVGIVVSDVSGVIYEANDIFLGMVGYTREELLAGMIHRKVITSPEYREADAQAIQKVLATGTVGPYEKAYIRKDGSLVPVLIGMVLFDEQQGLLLSIILDISERKELERRKDDFISFASHELRTPLAVSKGHVELASRRLQRLLQKSDLPEETTAALNTIAGPLKEALRAVRAQQRLIGDFLDVARIQARALEISPQHCDLVEIVREAVEHQRMLTPARPLQLHLPPGPVPIFAEPDRIGQVVSNYLTNAIKYSPEDQGLQVGLRVEGQTARVWVEDHGPGLSPEVQAHLWERFYRAPEGKAQHGALGGLGLGLYICRTLIELHHGHVGVQSEQGKGSTFWFTLPLAPTL
jgi:PAS domain S-box-containing protein